VELDFWKTRCRINPINIFNFVILMLNYFEIIKSDLRLIKSCILVSVTSLTAIVTYICIVISNILKVELKQFYKNKCHHLTESARCSAAPTSKEELNRNHETLIT